MCETQTRLPVDRSPGTFYIPRKPLSFIHTPYPNQWLSTFCTHILVLGAHCLKYALARCEICVMWISWVLCRGRPWGLCPPGGLILLPTREAHSFLLGCLKEKSVYLKSRVWGRLALIFFWFCDVCKECPAGRKIQSLSWSQCSCLPAPQYSYMKAPTPNVTGFGNRAWEEVTKVKWVQTAGP